MERSGVLPSWRAVDPCVARTGDHTFQPFASLASIEATRPAIGISLWRALAEGYLRIRAALGLVLVMLRVLRLHGRLHI
jgi:hypothetical protein